MFITIIIPVVKKKKDPEIKELPPATESVTWSTEPMEMT